MTFSILRRYNLLFWAGFFSVLFWPSLTVAQPLEAKINSLNGEVFVSFQGDPQLPAVVETILLEGDTIHTYAESKAVIRLPDGSILQLGGDTNLRFTALTQDKRKNTSRSRVELLWGIFRAVLSPLHQNPGSSFTVHTPNTLVYTSSSELDGEILYDPQTKSTFVLAHEFHVNVTNLLSGASLVIPQGHSAIIHERSIQEIARIVELPSLMKAHQQTAMLTSLQGEVFVSTQGEKWAPVLKGGVLRAGDAIQTNARAEAVLKFSDGTTLALEENTILDISRLMKAPQTDVWTLQLELFRGSLRTILGEGFRNADSSCIVQTPNVRMAIYPAREMDAEILYDPKRSLTRVMAHKSGLALLHLLTKTSATIPPGHSGLIHNHVIQRIARILRPLKKQTQK